MKLQLIIVLAVCAQFASECFGMGAYAKPYNIPSKESLELTISTDKNIFIKNESILIHVRLKNASLSNVFIEPLFIRENLFPFLTEENELSPQLLKEKGLHEKEGPRYKEEILLLKPNDSIDKDIKITFKYYKFNQTPGSYRLFIQYDNSWRTFEDVPSWIGKVESNVLDIELRGDK